jgi:cytochrome c-type biogenesis protein CcmH/NrfG
MTSKLLAHAQSCMDKDDYDNALRFYERAMALEPNNVEVLDAAADACIEVWV